MRQPGDWLDLEYAVDREDRISRVCDRWDRVAEDAGAPQLVAGRVVGSFLWGHVTDPTTRLLWEALAAAARSTGRHRSVPLRCDTPEWRRWIRLDVSVAGPELVFQSRLERVELRSRPLPLSPTPAAGEGSPLWMCSWCKRVAVRKDDWLELEEAAVRLGLFEEARPVAISHGICGSCTVRVAESFGIAGIDGSLGRAPEDDALDDLTSVEAAGGSAAPPRG